MIIQTLGGRARHTAPHPSIVIGLVGLTSGAKPTIRVILHVSPTIWHILRPTVTTGHEQLLRTLDDALLFAHWPTGPGVFFRILLTFGGIGWLEKFGGFFAQEDLIVFARQKEETVLVDIRNQIWIVNHDAAARFRFLIDILSHLEIDFHDQNQIGNWPKRRLEIISALERMIRNNETKIEFCCPIVIQIG